MVQLAVKRGLVLASNTAPAPPILAGCHQSAKSISSQGADRNQAHAAILYELAHQPVDGKVRAMRAADTPVFVTNRTRRADLGGLVGMDSEPCEWSWNVAHDPSGLGQANNPIPIAGMLKSWIKPDPTVDNQSCV